jgi:hypothetical protein
VSQRSPFLRTLGEECPFCCCLPRADLLTVLLRSTASSSGLSTIESVIMKARVGNTSSQCIPSASFVPVASAANREYQGFAFGSLYWLQLLRQLWRGVEKVYCVKHAYAHCDLRTGRDRAPGGHDCGGLDPCHHLRQRGRKEISPPSHSNRPIHMQGRLPQEKMLRHRYRSCAKYARDCYGFPEPRLLFRLRRRTSQGS